MDLLRELYQRIGVFQSGEDFTASTVFPFQDPDPVRVYTAIQLSAQFRCFSLPFSTDQLTWLLQEAGSDFMDLGHIEGGVPVINLLLCEMRLDDFVDPAANLEDLLAHDPVTALGKTPAGGTDIALWLEDPSFGWSDLRRSEIECTQHRFRPHACENDRVKAVPLFEDRKPVSNTDFACLFAPECVETLSQPCAARFLSFGCKNLFHRRASGKCRTESAVVGTDIHDPTTAAGPVEYRLQSLVESDFHGRHSNDLYNRLLVERFGERVDAAENGRTIHHRGCH